MAAVVGMGVGLLGGIGVGLTIIGGVVGTGVGGIVVGVGGTGVAVGGTGVGGVGVTPGVVSIVIRLVAFAGERTATTPNTEKMKSAQQISANLTILYPLAFSLFFTYFPYMTTSPERFTLVCPAKFLSSARSLMSVATTANSLRILLLFRL